MTPLIEYKLKHQYNYLHQLIAELSDAFIKTSFNDGKWSIHEHIAHLGRYHEIFLQRLEQILKGHSPTFERYIAENDIIYSSWVELDTNEIIKKTQQLRDEIFKRIDVLNEAEKLRTGVHPKLGNLDIFKWVDFFLLHETHHFYKIFWLIHENNSGEE